MLLFIRLLKSGIRPRAEPDLIPGMTRCLMHIFGKLFPWDIGKWVYETWRAEWCVWIFFNIFARAKFSANEKIYDILIVYSFSAFIIGWVKWKQIDYPFFNMRQCACLSFFIYYALCIFSKTFHINLSTELHIWEAIEWQEP